MTQYIHKLNKTGSHRCIMKPLRTLDGNAARHHKRSMGSGLVNEIYENGKIHKATDTLRNLKVSQPRIPKKYITFD